MLNNNKSTIGLIQNKIDFSQCVPLILIFISVTTGKFQSTGFDTVQTPQDTFGDDPLSETLPLAEKSITYDGSAK